MCHDALRTRDRVSSNLKAIRPGEGESVREEVGEDKDRGVDTGAPKFGALLSRYDSQSAGAGFEGGSSHVDDAVAVGVGLHDGHEASASGTAFDSSDIVADRAQVHLGPGTARDFRGDVIGQAVVR